MRDKILYIHTENLNFFYKLNKELTRKKVDFKILSVGSKIVDSPSLVLTTLGEFNRFKRKYKNLKFLTFDENSNFKYFILKVLAAYKTSYKEIYSNLIFSIDPGSKKIGMVVFLDGYYLISHTFYDKKAFIISIKDYIECFQNEDLNQLKLTFKFGGGILPLTLNLIEKILNIYQTNENLKIYLIDEAKSSKIKIQNRKKLFKTKHELSALIIALRIGVELNKSNYTNNLLKNKSKGKYSRIEIGRNSKKKSYSGKDTRKLIEKIINGDISLSQSYELINEQNKQKKLII